MTDPARNRQLGHGITAVDTDYVRPFMDASHLIEHGGRVAFVDTGTNHSVPLLLEALAESGRSVDDVDYLFLTHIHLDHAGGAGRLMQALPGAKIVVHPRGARHMIDPARLIAGSIAVYGKEVFDKLYGQLEPIDADRIILAEDGDEFELGGRPLRLFHTEGHARHHYCIDDPTSRGVFTGDSFGLSLREFDTDRGAFIFPTTTPVHFDPPEAHKSIDRILGLQPERLFLTHYSEVTEVERLGEDMHRRLDAFVQLAEEAKDKSHRTDYMQKAMHAYLVDELRAHGNTDDEVRLRQLLQMDVRLNVMGIEHWLDTRNS